MNSLKDRKIRLSVSSIFVLTLLSALITGCTEKPAELIVGKWTGVSISEYGEENEIEMEFKEDGEVFIYEEDIEKISCRYELKDHIISGKCKSEGEVAPIEYQFLCEFKGADRLIGELSIKIKGLSKAYEVLKNDLSEGENNTEENKEDQSPIKSNYDEITIKKRLKLEKIKSS